MEIYYITLSGIYIYIYIYIYINLYMSSYYLEILGICSPGPKLQFMFRTYFPQTYRITSWFIQLV